MQPDRPCEVCRQRLDAVAHAIGRHPNCGPYTPLSDTAYRRLVDHLADSLGAEVATEKATQ